jgi:predicted MFS family arabinose efflux permease
MPPPDRPCQADGPCQTDGPCRTDGPCQTDGPCRTGGLGTGGVGGVEITFFFTAFIAVTYAFGIYLFATMLPDMRRALGFGPELVGIATGLAQGGLMLAGLANGLLTHRLGPMRLILLSIALCALCLLAMPLATGGGAVVPILALLGISAAVWIPITAVVQQAIPRRHQGKALGLMSSGAAYGALANGIAVPPLLAAWGWRSPWIAAGLLTTALLVAAAIRIRALGRLPNGPDSAAARPSLGSAARQILAPVPMLTAAILFFSGLVFVPFQTYLTSLLRDDLLWSVEAAGVCWGLIGAGGTVGGLIIGAISDRLSAKWALVLTYGMLLCSSAALIMPDSPWLAYAGSLVFGLSYYAIFGLIAAYIAKAFEPAIATPLQGITFVAVGCGSMIGNYGGSLAAAAAGGYAVIYAAACLGSILLIFGALLLPRERTEPSL